MALTLADAHGIAMILSWMVFGSTGVLFARYGRPIRLGNRRQLLGKAVWFQVHRFLLSLTALLTLLGFFFILIYTGGQWVNPQLFGLRLFIHSIFGGTIVCCTIIQVWLALYRCNPHSRFRYIFAWSHRITGFLAFGLSTPTIFLIIILFYSTVLTILISLWTSWIVIIILLFEKNEHRQRVAALPAVTNIRGGDTNQKRTNTNSPADIESDATTNVGSQYHNLLKLMLFFIHIIVSITLSVLLIIFICQ